MKKRNLFFVLIAMVTLFFACSKTDGDNTINCKITGKIFVKAGEKTYVVQGIDINLVPKNSKMQYFQTVKADQEGIFSFNPVNKGTEYKLTVSGNLAPGEDVEGGAYSGETDFFTVSKDQLIKKDIYLEKQ
jgi:hypothetical protein